MLLTLLTFLPLVGALAVLLAPKENVRLQRTIALATSIVATRSPRRRRRCEPCAATLASPTGGGASS